MPVRVACLQRLPLMRSQLNATFERLSLAAIAEGAVYIYPRKFFRGRSFIRLHCPTLDGPLGRDALLLPKSMVYIYSSFNGRGTSMWMGMSTPEDATILALCMPQLERESSYRKIHLFDVEIPGRYEHR